MTSERFVLKHFYYGQFVRDGQPVGDLRLLARSHGLGEEDVAEALQLALIPPMRGRDNGSWAIVRGKKLAPFILVEAEFGKAGQLILHFMLLNSDLVRSLGGNLRLLDPLIDGEMPQYEQVGNAVRPLVLSDVAPPSEDQEAEDILNFMMSCRSRMNIMESLLAAVVQGVPLIIVNAPDNPNDRKAFIMGMLALLPPSVRFAVTFATHTLASTKIDVQIRFWVDDASPMPDNAVVYDWKAKKVSGREVKDEYSSFIISQLRLDMDLVLQQTRQLTGIASWRVRQGDRLAAALGYASQRMTVDDAVRSGQPIEADKVSKILANDPTLSDDMRQAYARHLMSFSMALGELEYAEPLGVMLAGNPELADTAYDMLHKALLKGGAGDIFDLLTKWLSNPLGPRGIRWTRFVHECAKIYLSDIMDDGDFDEVIQFLKDVDVAGSNIAADEIMPQLLRDAEQFALMDTDTARMVFTMSCKYVSVDALDSQLSQSAYVTHMPDAIQYLMSVFKSGHVPDQTGLLMRAAAGYRAMQRLVMVRLVELCLKYDRLDLIDETTLKQLVKVARSDWGQPYFGMLLQIVERFSTDEMMRLRQVEGDDTNRLVLSLLLALGYYKDLARRMLDQSRVLYSGNNQGGYLLMIQRLFAETPLSVEQVPHALDDLQEGGIRSLPLVTAYIGVLDNQRPSEISDAVAFDVTDLIEDNSGLIEMIPLDTVTTLIQYHMKRQNTALTVRVSAILPLVAARYGERTATMMAKVYRYLEWDAEVKAARMEMLRIYIRSLERRAAYKALDGLGMILGEDVRHPLAATYAIRVAMNGHDLVEYAKIVHELATLLQDTYEAYHGDTKPTIGGIYNDLDSMPGNLETKDRRRIAQEIVTIGRLVLQLGGQHSRVRGSDSKRRIEGLLKGEESPQSAVEMIRAMGGYLAQGKRAELELRTLQSPHPLQSRTAYGFVHELDSASDALESLLNSLSQGRLNLSGDMIHSEMESLWQTISVNAQREIVRDFAVDLQRLADLIPLIASSGDLRALEDTSIGRKLAENKSRPRNVLEFYRFVAGYYLLRA